VKMLPYPTFASIPAKSRLFFAPVNATVSHLENAA